MPVEPGSTGIATLTVSELDTAITFGSGDMPALATARVVALGEEACVAATEGQLDDDRTTVGAAVQLTHVAPCAVGTSVKAEATLEKIEGRRLHFTVKVTDDRGLVAAGRLTRALVDRQTFRSRVEE